MAQNNFEITVSYKIWDKWENPISLKSYFIIELKIENKESRLYFVENKNE